LIGSAEKRRQENGGFKVFDKFVGRAFRKGIDRLTGTATTQ